MASRSRKHLADRRHNPLGDHAEHDQEDEQHEEERAVGDQEVALPAAFFGRQDASS